jgi:chemotaxis protein methyltransferase CheR
MTLADAGETGTFRRLREFAFSNEDFQALRTLVKKVTGINLTEQKRELVYARLARRLRVHNLKTFGEYRRLLKNDGGFELVQLCNAITTNLTSFFREPHHFEYLRSHFLAPLLANPPPNRRLRIWSAGCSTGEEPYSIAMTIFETVPDLSRWDIKILATDIDLNVLEHARRGIYGADRIRYLREMRRTQFFRPREELPELGFEIRPEVMRMVTFKPLNLIQPFPMKGPLDIIFCRNTIIYFDRDTQQDLISRMARLQTAGQLLFVGHSENLLRNTDTYSLIGRTIYRRC